MTDQDDEAATLAAEQNMTAEDFVRLCLCRAMDAVASGARSAAAEKREFSPRDAAELAVFCALTLIDGVTDDSPPITLVRADGVAINSDVYLHDLRASIRRKELGLKDD